MATAKEQTEKLRETLERYMAELVSDVLQHDRAFPLTLDMERWHSSMDAHKRRAVALILLAIKEAGLKFTGIEEWEEKSVHLKLHKIIGEIEL